MVKMLDRENIAAAMGLPASMLFGEAEASSSEMEMYYSRIELLRRPVFLKAERRRLLLRGKIAKAYKRRRK
jgi:hypothetical protein